nr:Dihydrofolate reductase [uncultured bacterium]
MKKIIGIWAQTENGIIGKDQAMPWHLPAEATAFQGNDHGTSNSHGKSDL